MNDLSNSFLYGGMLVFFIITWWRMDTIKDMLKELMEEVDNVKVRLL